jgi:hypothetical protein
LCRVIRHDVPLYGVQGYITLQCLASYQNKMYSDTSANEDNSLRNHIR